MTAVAHVAAAATIVTHAVAVAVHVGSAIRMLKRCRISYKAPYIAGTIGTAGKTVMRAKEWGLTFFGIFSLFWPWVSVKPFVNDDYDAELKRNKQLAARPKAEIDKQRDEYEPEVKRRLRTFRWGVWGAFSFLVTAIIAATVLAVFFWYPSPNAKVWLGNASIFAFAWATLARLGKGGTSWGGKTVLERIDLRVLWILYWIGTLLGTLTLI
jgi:hypothetical protein